MTAPAAGSPASRRARAAICCVPSTTPSWSAAGRRPRLRVEGGGRVPAGLLPAGLVDRVVWFRAPAVIGGDGVPAAAAFGIGQPGDAPRFVREDLIELGDDRLETYRVQR